MSALGAFSSKLLEAIVSEAPESLRELERTSISPTHSTPPATSTLDAFPCELIDAIASKSPTKSLENLCLAGRRFVEPTQRRLFRRAVINSEAQRENLAAVLSSKPYLAQYVELLAVSTLDRTGGILWPVASIRLPSIMLKFIGIKSFLLLSNNRRQMKWNDPPATVENCGRGNYVEAGTHFGDTDGSYFLVSFALARLLGRAASLKKILLRVTFMPLFVATLLPLFVTTPDPDESFPLIQSAPRAVLSGVSSSMLGMLLPASPCPFINTSNIHSLDLDGISSWDDIMITNTVLDGLPSSRHLRIGPFNLAPPRILTHHSPEPYATHEPLSRLLRESRRRHESMPDRIGRQDHIHLPREFDPNPPVQDPAQQHRNVEKRGSSPIPRDA